MKLVIFFHHWNQALIELLYSSTEYIWGSPSPNGTSLEYDGQHNGFFLSHFLVIPGHPGVFWTQGTTSFTALTGRVGQARCQVLSFEQLVGGKPQPAGGLYGWLGHHCCIHPQSALEAEIHPTTLGDGYPFSGRLGPMDQCCWGQHQSLPRTSLFFKE